MGKVAGRPVSSSISVVIPEWPYFILRLTVTVAHATV